MKKPKKHKEYGFWKHDQFPYVLCSIGTLEDDGWFKADRYGGASFRPIKVLSLEEGHKVALALEALAGEYRVIMDSVHRGFISRIILAAPWVPLFSRDDLNKLREVRVRESTLTEVDRPPAGPPQKG